MKLEREGLEGGKEMEGLSFYLSSKSEPGSLSLDADLLSWPLILRQWEGGDSFIPLGMEGSQKISDHLTNRKVPSSSRKNTLVLCGNDGIIYSVIFPQPSQNREPGTISEKVKYNSHTSSYLIIQQAE